MNKLRPKRKPFFYHLFLNVNFHLKITFCVTIQTQFVINTKYSSIGTSSVNEDSKNKMCKMLIWPTFTFNLYWFHSFMNLSVNHDHLYVYCYSPCSHYPQPVDKKIKLRCLHPSSTRLGGLKGDPSFLHSSAS